ncbi:MAG: RHS repeat-associated core domain-containing protein [Acidobacteriota bacterium]
MSSETVFYGPAAVDGSCASCPSHSVAFSLNSTCGPSHDQACTWDGNGRHYNLETHDGNLANANRTISTVWNPVNWTVSPTGRALPNIAIQRTESDSPLTLTVNRFFEFDTAGSTANGFLNCSFLHDATRQRVFFNRRYSATDGTLAQEFTASAYPYPGPPAIGACASTYPTPPVPSGIAMGNNGDIFGKIYTYQNGLLTSTRWINGNNAAGWYAKRFDRDTSTGWVTNSHDSAGLATSYVYDVLGRVTGLTPPGEAATTVTYPSAVQTTASRNAGTGLSTYQEYDYDGLGRLRREVRSMPASKYAVRTHAFDDPGHAYFDSEWATCTSPAGDCQSAAPGGTTSSNFDPFGRAQNIVRADGATTTVSLADTYSGYSDTKKTVTAKNVGGSCAGGSCSGGSDSPTVFIRDAFGRLTSVTEPGGDVTKYNYDINGKLTCVKQGGTQAMATCTDNPGGQYRSFVYDPNGFLMQEKTPEKGTVNYDCYGGLGNLVLQSPPGVQVANNYDFAARVTATRSNEQGSALTNPCQGQAIPSGGRVYLSNTYNDTTPGNSYGRLTSRVGSSFFQPGVGTSYNVTDAFAYNGLGARISSQTTTVSGTGVSTTQSWMYNGLGLLAHHYHARASGQTPLVLSWGYDAGVPVKGYVNGIPMVKSAGYAPSGALSAYTTGMGFGTDVTTAIAQDATLLPRPASITTSGGTQSFATGAYAYDGAGNIKAMGATDTFGYDLRSRLTSANLLNLQGAPVSQGYSYDRYGNLLTKGGTTYSVNATTNGLTTASYDLRGNVTGNGGDVYAYDGLDRMEYNRTGSTEWDYVYDAEGERVVKIPPLGASWTYTFRDEGKRVSTEYSGAVASRDNVYLGSLLVASYANGSVGSNGPVWTFYASDHLGTPRLITDAGGTAVEQRKTFPFGEVLGSQGLFQRVRFAAMERDVEGASGGTGGSRHQDHARSQEFNLGRFLSPDKLQGKIPDPQSWNRYAYSLNNPLKFLDPNGLEVRYADKQLQTLFTRLSAKYPAVRGALGRYTGEGKPDLVIRKGDAGRDPLTGEKALGLTKGTNVVESYDWSKITSTKDSLPDSGKFINGATLKETTITIDSSLGAFSKDQADTAVHEAGHADSLARDPVSYLMRGAWDQDMGPDGKWLPHDDRPLEKEANQFRDRTCGVDKACNPN